MGDKKAEDEDSCFVVNCLLYLTKCNDVFLFSVTRTASKVYGCFNNLTQSSICSGSSGGIDESEFLQSEKDDTFTKVGDVCSKCEYRIVKSIAFVLHIVLSFSAF